MRSMRVWDDELDLSEMNVGFEDEVRKGGEGVWELRCRGRTVREIAAETGLSCREVVAQLEETLEEMAQESGEVGLAVLCDQIDRVYRNAVSLSMTGEKGAGAALGVALKAIQLKAQLRGLEAPKRLEVTTESVVDAEVRKLVAEIEAGL